MTLLFRKSLRYKNFSTGILFRYTLIKNRLILTPFSSCSKSYIALTRKTTFAENATVDTIIIRDKATQGFTLVELIITIAILVIILAIAAPSVQTKLASMEALRIKNQVETSLAIAKSESYIRKENVLVCLSNDGEHCQRDDDKMLLVFIDKSDSKNYDAQVDLLITQQSLNPKYSKLSLRVGNRRHYTKFWGDSGTPRGHFGHIKYCPIAAYNKAMYLISFNQAGIVKQKLDENHPTQCDE